MNSDFKELLSLLDQFGVRYLVAGGYAVMLYAEPRYTKDIDVVVGVSESDLDGLAKALLAFGFPAYAAAVKELMTPNRMLSLGNPPMRVDVLNEISGIDFNDAWERRNLVRVNGQEVAFISLADLVATKKAAGRPQDSIDLQSLEPLLESN